MRISRSLKKVDSVLGRLAVILLSSVQAVTRPDSLQRILFIRPGGIGDAVLLIPAIRAVRSRFPDATIHILAEKRNAEVFLLCSEIKHVYCYDKRGELLSVLRNSYDVVIDTEQWHRLSAVVARLFRAPMTVGFGTNERRKLFSHPVPYSHADYEVASFLHLIEPVVASTAVFHPDLPFLSVREADRSNIDQYLRPLSKSRIVALFPGSTIAERRWGSARFHDVAAQLEKRGYGVVTVGGRGDICAGESIVSGIAHSINLCGKLSLPETAAVLSRSSLLITGDSGIMHLGYAVGTKVVALFGPGIEEKWAPRSPRVTVLNKHLACSPCTEYGYTPRCRSGAACMKRISVDEVVSAAVTLLDKH